MPSLVGYLLRGEDMPAPTTLAPRGAEPFAMVDHHPILLVTVAIAAPVLHIIPGVEAPMMVAIALTTTSLGTLIPILRDGGLLSTGFGRLLLAAGTVGEVAPIVAVSLVLSHRYTSWQELGFLVVFLGSGAAAIGVGARPPAVLELLSRTLRQSTQCASRSS